ncbi:hypothetical protein BASA81_013225 [Batrachochytrium salamandrivorans]|nr:hypothetical protein BASA81_013225 [Batrachochytrium salamandrivorans]
MLRIVVADEHSHHYEPNEEVTVWYNTIAPLTNKQETYEYTQLPFCLGTKKVAHYHESLGEALLGLELIHSGMDVPFLETKKDSVLCTAHLSRHDISLFTFAVQQSYYYSAYIDNLPLRGPIGISNTSDLVTRNYLYTDRQYSILVNKDQIVGIHLYNNNPVLLDTSTQVSMDIVFTYSVEWVQSNITFETRFDQFLESSFFEHNIHWFSIINSFMMVIFLVGVVTVILLRTIKRDFSRYEHEEGLLDIDRDLGDEYGWKLVHGDVFRAPSHLTLFSALNGVGLQLILMAFFVIIATIAGNLYVERATMLTASIFIYALTSIVAGYYSGSIYTKFSGKRWIVAMMASSLIWPGTVSTTAFLINFIAIYYQTSRAIPFHNHENWAGALNSPCRINPIPRPIPDRTWYAEPSFVILAGGLLPFGAVFIELYFISRRSGSTRYITLWIYAACICYPDYCHWMCIDCFYICSAERRRSSMALDSVSVECMEHSKPFGTLGTPPWHALRCFCMLGTVGNLVAERFVRSIYSNVKVD